MAQKISGDMAIILNALGENECRVADLRRETQLPFEDFTKAFRALRLKKLIQSNDYMYNATPAGREALREWDTEMVTPGRLFK